jgi:hypothetical protein
MNETGMFPAPWRLTGAGYLILLRCARVFGNACARDQPALAGRALGGFGAVMVINYDHSDVGPYRELLIAPGSFKYAGRSVFALTHIWVSTAASMIHGRHNWGLPKQQADFDWMQGPGRRERVIARRADHPPLELELSASTPALPVTTNVLPRRWRTLEQVWNGRVYRTRVRARGQVSSARLHDYANPAGSGFPDFADQKHLFCLHAPTFELTFPAARIRAAD